MVRVMARQMAARYWNGRYGRLARRDIWLWADEPRGTWTVEICNGGVDTGLRAEWTYPDEPAARAQVARCLDTGGDGWRELPVSR